MWAAEAQNPGGYRIRILSSFIHCSFISEFIQQDDLQFAYFDGFRQFSLPFQNRLISPTFTPEIGRILLGSCELLNDWLIRLSLIQVFLALTLHSVL